jgi:DNA (cytosine-5)-methyltransferase 1
LTRTGYRLGRDERNFLFEYMVAAALELRPRIFLMENVPGMQSARKEKLSFLEAAAHMLEDLGGFKTTIWQTNASAYGVPQDRLRYFLVASATGDLPTRPIEDYQDHRQDFDVDALPPVTVQEALFDLPDRISGQGYAVEWFSRQFTGTDPRFRRYLAKFRILTRSRLLFNHTVRYHNPRDLELYSLLRPGEDSIHVLERHGRADLMRYRRDVFDDKYARLRGDRPSKTIVAHLAKDGNGYVHPTQTRSISIREAARLQSFRDDYVFCGSASDQWTQIGNAVPPILAETIARSLLQVLGRR